MKVLAASDIHGDLNLVKSLALKAEKNKVDMVLLCGDLTLSELSIEGIIGPFKEKNLKVGIIPGNHESRATNNFLTEKYKLINLHGYSYYTEKVGLFGCGSANVGMFQMSEEEIFSSLKGSHENISKASKKIMLTHVHPSESLMERMIPGSGSLAVKKAIEEFQPDFALCGHLHEAAGIEEIIGKTKLINVGREGKILEL